MTDWIYEWCGVDDRTHTRLWNAQRRAQDARTRAYLPVYWRDCVDVEFEREFACFGGRERAAA